jgi:YebC/PmpR family DNA-binding regulatory protein
MSGHSKWSTIKRQKGLKDAAKGQIFTKLANAIANAARSGTDPDTNFSLRLAIDKAKSNNMPMSNIQRAIDRVSDKDSEALEEVLYEGYGPGGVAILVNTLTDNINRTYPEVRLAFSKHGGSIADKGSVVFQFEHKGQIKVKGNYDDILLQSIELNADDVIESNDEIIIYTDLKKMAFIRDGLRSNGVNILEADLVYLPKQIIEINDESIAGKIVRLMDALDEINDVSEIYVNFEIADKILEKIRP